MATATALKKELDFNWELMGLIDVMKGIAALQFQTQQKRKERFQRFIDSFSSFFELIDFGSIKHPFGSVSTERMGIIMVTSDEGFMGGLNAHVVHAALAERKNEAELIILGDRGASHLKEMKEEFITFPGVTEGTKYDLALKLKDYIITQSKLGKIGKVILAYPLSLSFTFQRVEIVKLLPCTELFEERKEVVSKEKVIMESDLEGVIEHLAAGWITHKLYEVFEDAKLSEFAARTMNLEQSYQNLSQLQDNLRYQYLKARHGAIDLGMRELFASQLSKKRLTR